MKLKTTLLITFLCLLSFDVWAQNSEFDVIKKRSFVACGTDLSTKSFAYTDESGTWRGIDADICRNFAAAILGNSESFKLYDVPLSQSAQMLNNRSIDVMLGNSSLSAKQEALYLSAITDVLYFDRQVFVTRKQTNNVSMNDYKGAKVCVLNNSADFSNLSAYNSKYGMEFKILPFHNMNEVKQAFLLNRCELACGSEIYFKGIEQTLVAKENNLFVLPETISIRPVYAYVSPLNLKLQKAGKWIINALKLASENEINKNNIDAFASVKDSSVRNLLGFEPDLWTYFGLQPTWVVQAIKDRGNFEEMFETNLGSESHIKLDKRNNSLLKNGGMISSLPFI